VSQLTQVAPAHSVTIRQSRGRVAVQVALWASIIIFALVVVKTAWMSDDAYITLRTVDNVVNGYGLTWNPGERVQTYTHPLWMLLITGFYFVTREAYYTVLALSIFLSILAVLLLASRLAISKAAAVFAVVALTLSKAFRTPSCFSYPL
jgi:arabinofuranosyltransferase